VDDETLEQKRGVVLEGITCSDNSLILTGGTAVNEAEGDPVSGFMGGRIDIKLANPADPLEGGMEAISFDGVDVVDNSGVMTYTFPVGRVSSLRGVIRVPVRGVLVGGMLLSLELWALARASGTLPTLTLGVRRVPRPSADCTKLTLPGSDSALGGMDLGSCGSVTANQYLRKTSDQLAVGPGDLVYVAITRSSGDGYNGDLGLLHLGWKLDVP
jgi:hypothetical protein